MRNENFDKTSVTICRFRIFIKIRNKSQLAGRIVKSWGRRDDGGREMGKAREYFDSIGAKSFYKESLN